MASRSRAKPRTVAPRASDPRTSAQLEAESVAAVERAATVPTPAAAAGDAPTTVSTRDADRAAELARQAAVVTAVHDATHDKAGAPIPLGVADVHGITIVEGKP